MGRSGPRAPARRDSGVLNAHRTWAVAALAAWIASAALQLIADATRISVASAAINGTGVSLTDAQNSDRLVSLAALIHLGVFVLAAVTFLMWLYRAVANNHALGAYELRFTPGWAVGWWFVPFANLVRPLQIIAEAWRAADPSASRSTVETRSRLRTPAIVIAWWLLYLIGNVIALFERWTSGDPLTRTPWRNRARHRFASGLEHGRRIGNHPGRARHSARGGKDPAADPLSPRKRDGPSRTSIIADGRGAPSAGRLE